MADCYTLFTAYGFVAPKETFPKAKEAALRGLQLDDTLAEAHTSRAFTQGLYDWDWSGAEREFRRAIALNPSYAVAHSWYGVISAFMGRSEEAITQGKRALELDPLSLPINWVLELIFYLARQYDQAIEQGRRTMELDPNFVGIHYTVGEAYFQKSMHKEAITEFEKAIEIAPEHPVTLSLLGHAYALTGGKANAGKVLVQLTSKQKYVSPTSVALVYVGLGEKEKAFGWLEKAYEDRSLGMTYALKADPIFDPLRSDPRYADLLRRMNLQP